MATLRGTNNDDIIRQNGYAEVTIFARGGDDDIYLNRTDSSGGFNTVEAGTGDDYVLNYFEGGNDVLMGDGNDFYVADIRAGDSSDYDVVRGGNGNDRFSVDTEASDYFGDAGNDSFKSVGFENYFNGGTGIDSISYELQDSYASQQGKGVTIDLGKRTASTTNGQSETLISIENATGTNRGNDDITGSTGRNILTGLGGQDTIYGLGGGDDLYGGAGSDDLFGGSGDDDLIGSSGNDLLVGGSGFDFLNGGTGADTFEFGSIFDSAVGAKRDVIEDFRRSQDDVIDLESIDANELRSGDQSFSFIGGNTFNGKAGELRFSAGVISGDTDGDGFSDFQIKVNGVTKMYADDFFL